MATRSGNIDRPNLSAADLAAEVSRLEALFNGALGSKELIQAKQAADLLKAEMSRGPLATLLLDADGNAQLALLRAQSHVAADQARRHVRDDGREPLWRAEKIVKLLFIPLVLGVLIPALVNFATAQQQLNLFREQKAIDAARAQADVLLGQLSSLVIKTRELKDAVAYFGVEGMIPADHAGRLNLKAVELEQQFRAAVGLHSFDAVPEVREAQLIAFYELRALQDCLRKSAGETPSGKWRRDVAASDQKLLATATSDEPCSSNFNAAAFETFAGTVNRAIEEPYRRLALPASENVRDRNANCPSIAIRRPSWQPEKNTKRKASSTRRKVRSRKASAR